MLGVGILAVVLVRTFVVQPYAVASDSMLPTLAEGERVLVTKYGSVDIGDVVVADVTEAWPGPDRSTHIDDGPIGTSLASASSALGIDLGERSVVGRVVAGGGDEVTCCTDGRVRVDGEAVGPRLDDAAVPFRLTVPPGRVFLLSDSATSSSDSRTHVGAGSTDGTVSEDALVGTVVTRIWPLDRLGAPSSSFTAPQSRERRHQ
jgi:signal peptidase I